MLGRVVGALVPTLLGWSLISGAIPIGGSFSSHAGLSRDVPAGVDAVAEAVAGLDTDYFTHVPGGDRRVAEALPRAVGRRTADGYAWQITSGSDVTAELIVTLKPIDGGRTHVETDVHMLKPAPAAWLMPGASVLGPAFAEGIEAQINPLLPESERLSDEAVRRKRLKAAAMISSMQLSANPGAIEAESRRIAEERRAAAASNVSFRPGKPMVDVSRY